MRIAAPVPRSRETVSLSSFHRLVVVAAAMLLGAPGSARGASPRPPVEGEPDDVLTRVDELWRSGQDHFETSDFASAIELWTLAYEELPDGPEHQRFRAMLLAHLAQAHVQAHGIDGDVEHLRRADGLYVDYLPMIDPQDTQTREFIETQRQQIAALLEQEAQREREREQAAQAERDAAATAAGVAKPEPRGDPPAEPAPVGRARRDGVAPYTKWERALVIGGGVTLALAVGMIGATGAFVWLHRAEERKRADSSSDPNTDPATLRELEKSASRFNGLAISTGAMAGALGVIGLGLVGGAVAHRRRRVKERPMVFIAPAGSALVVRGRF